MKFEAASKEYVDKCPACHQEYLTPHNTDKVYGIAELNEKNGKLDDMSFIPLIIKKCPHCGAIFLFEK